MKLSYYYWSYQCPLSHEMLEVLHTFENKYEIETYDLMKHPNLAKEKQIYYPFLLIVNDTYRYYSPFNEAFIQKLEENPMIEEPPYFIPLGKQVVKETLIRLCNDELDISCQCSGGCSNCSITCKREFYKTMNQDFYGYIMVDENNTLLGGVEYVSSMNVPYDIIKDPNSAFITCIYSSHTEYDYKTTPLLALEKELSKTYQEVYVISDEVGTFPNGDIDFFQSHGYIDKGILQKNAYCCLHLMYKDLSTVK